MREQPPLFRPIPLGVIVALSSLVLATGGCTSPELVQNQTPSPTTSSSPRISPSPQPTKSVVVSNEKTVQIYWLKSRGNHFEVVPSSVTMQSTDSKSVLLENAFKHLLTGHPDTNFTTTIPQGTKLRSVQVSNDGVHVDLSQAFTSGGGSASMMGRVAQVLYTASSLNPDAKVWINVDGKKLERLGGEGLEVIQPLTRKDFQKNFEL